MTAIRDVYENNEPRELWICVGPQGRHWESFGMNRIVMCQFNASGLHGEGCGFYHVTKLSDKYQPERP